MCQCSLQRLLLNIYEYLHMIIYTKVLLYSYYLVLRICIYWKINTNNELEEKKMKVHVTKVTRTYASKWQVVETAKKTY